MVRAIITWSLHNRLIVLLGTLMLVIAGLYSANNLNVEAYPDPTPPLVEVIAQNPGASPEEMERLGRHSDRNRLERHARAGRPAQHVDRRPDGRQVPVHLHHRLLEGAPGSHQPDQRA